MESEKSIFMDFIVGLPTTNCKHDSIWVIIDIMTKMCQFVPTKTTIKSLKLAQLFADNVY